MLVWAELVVKIYMTKIKEEIGLISSSYNITDHAYSLLGEKMNDFSYYQNNGKNLNQNSNNRNGNNGSQKSTNVRLHPQIKEQRELQRKNSTTKYFESK